MNSKTLNDDDAGGVRHAGTCAWHGTISEFLSLDRGGFLALMKAANSEVSGYPAGHPQYKAWRDEFKHLRRELAKLGAPYRRLHIAFEYVLPGHPDKDTGHVLYEKRPDVVIFSSGQVLVLEFKQREPPPYDGFAKETRGYLRLLEKWHSKVPRMGAKGLLVLTKAVDFGKKYPRVKAISPDRIPSQIRKVFADALEPHPAPEEWLADISHVELPPLWEMGLFAEMLADEEEPPVKSVTWATDGIHLSKKFLKEVAMHPELYFEMPDGKKCFHGVRPHGRLSGVGV